MAGAENLWWILWLHGSAGYALLVLLRWKGAVILQSLGVRPSVWLPRAAFLTLLGLLLVILGTGLAWVFVGPLAFAGFSLLTIHAMLALAVAVLLGWHVLSFRFIFGVRRAIDRRAALSLGALGVVGVAVWEVAALGSRVFNVPGAQRRFTGSYETASFSGDFPTVSWLFDDPTPIDARTWQLRIAGAVEQPLAIDYARLLELATATLTATLDCTGGWYSTQEWRGAPVGQLLNLAQPKATAHTVIFHSSTGHDRRYSLAEARQLLLATHVGGTPLNHDHGFPARLVAPGHRGYDWVKWVIGIEVVESAWFWQLPLPLR